MSKPLVIFNPKLPTLTRNQEKVLELLVEAGKLIAPLYEQQENPEFPGANFYPADISREDIEKAAKKDPQILSPYTVVEKVEGKLVAVPYHEKFAKFLKPIVKKLTEAAEATDNKEFSQRLKMQAKALLDGSYETAIASWMSMEPYVLDLNIGPVERYDDKLFFVKTSYQAWVGVMDDYNTQTFNKYKDIILSARRKSLMPSEKVDYYDKIQTRVDDVLLMSGLIARTLFVGVNLPNDTHLMEKHGSEITLFKQTNELRHQKNLVIFNKIFSPQFRKQFNPKVLETGSLYTTALHELAHTYLRYHGSEERLKDLFPVIDELGATAMGIKVCGTLLLKDIVSQQQLESIMLADMVRYFHNVINEVNVSSKHHYVVGGAIFINFLLESGAIKEVGGISWPNFLRMFVTLNELASILERMLSQGTRKDAEEFIKKYGDYKKLQRFS